METDDFTPPALIKTEGTVSLKAPRRHRLTAKADRDPDDSCCALQTRGDATSLKRCKTFPTGAPNPDSTHHRPPGEPFAKTTSLSPVPTTKQTDRRSDRGEGITRERDRETQRKTHHPPGLGCHIVTQLPLDGAVRGLP